MSSRIYSDEQRNELEKLIRENIYGVGEQFVADSMGILDKYRNDSYINDLPGNLVS